MRICHRQMLGLLVLVLGSVHSYTHITKSDEADDVSVELLQNETELSNQNDSSTPEVSSSNLEAHSYNAEFPYMAAIVHTNNLLLGAGAVVGETWILVTGFQMGAFKPDQLRVRVGSSSGLSGGALLPVEGLYPHPMYAQFNNDVALLKTNESLFKNSTAQAISVATKAPTLGTEGNFIFWNKESQVQSSEADIIPVEDCRTFFPDFELTESNICIVMDYILPYRVTLFGSLLVVNGSLVGLYMGLEANTFKPYLCSNLSPINEWIQHMMKNKTETINLFPIT